MYVVGIGASSSFSLDQNHLWWCGFLLSICGAFCFSLIVLSQIIAVLCCSYGLQDFLNFTAWSNLLCMSPLFWHYFMDSLFEARIDRCEVIKFHFYSLDNIFKHIWNRKSFTWFAWEKMNLTDMSLFSLLRDNWEPAYH